MTQNQTRESILADLGLNVIWYKGGNNHQELHIILDEIHKGKTNEDKDNDTVKQ